MNVEILPRRSAAAAPAKRFASTLLAANGLRLAAIAVPLVTVWLIGYWPMLTVLAAATLIAVTGAFSAADRTLRSVCWEVVVVSLVLMLGAFLVHNTIANLTSRNIASGFGFLNREARFEISETLIAYSPASSYGSALLVGVLNTLKVSIIGIIIATLIGVGIGILGLGRNWLVARLAGGYVHALRNVPVLLHIFLWYTAITNLLPPLRQSLTPLPGVFLSQRGLYYPVPEPAMGWVMALLGLAAGLVLLVIAWRLARQLLDRTGRPMPLLPLSLGLLLGLPTLGWLIGGAPTVWSVPELKGFNFAGGQSLSPEFFAILGGLATYTSAYIAEITRAGILSVSKGQFEAGRALGLSEAVLMRKVVLPQALRVMIPPFTNQYLNLTKNSSLAVAVGYPDLVSVANTTLNQTGQAIECISILMMVYLTTSLITSALMNWYNYSIRLVER